MSDESAAPAPLSPAAFHRACSSSDWRVTGSGPQAVFRTASLAQAAELVPRIVAASARHDVTADVDLRAEAVIVRVPDRGEGIPAATPAFADDVSQAAAEAGLTSDPAAVQSVGLYVAQHSSVDARPFFLAALGYDELGDTDAVDPLRRGPALAFNPISGDVPARGRTHLDVFVPGDQAQARVDAAIAAGGRLVDDSNAPAWWTVASPDNHGVDIASWADTYE